MHMRVLRGLSGKALPCGCLAGVYETYDGRVVTLIDARGPRCADAGHQAGVAVIDLVTASDIEAPLAVPGSRPGR